jgi:hypothetical protein
MGLREQEKNKADLGYEKASSPLTNLDFGDHFADALGLGMAIIIFLRMGMEDAGE